MRTAFYILSLPFQTAVTNGTTVSPEVQIGNEYDFEIYEVRASIYKLAVPTGPVLCSLKLSGGVNLTENPTDLFAIASQNIANYSGYPIKLAVGDIIESSTKVIAEITNNSGANVNVQIQLIGRKIFKS